MDPGYDPGASVAARDAAERAAARKAQTELVLNGGGEPSDIIEFVGYATDEQKSQYLDSLGVDISLFHQRIEQGLGNREYNGKPLRGASNYDKDKILEKIAQKDKANQEILIEYVTSDVADRSFAEFLDDNPDLIETYIDTALNENRDLWDKFVAFLSGESDTEQIESTIGGFKDTRRERLIDALLESGEPEETEDLNAQAEKIDDSVAKQCILLNLLPQLSRAYNDDLVNKCVIVNNTNETASPLDYKGKGIPYSNRIVKMNVREPSTFVNYLTGVPGINQNFTNLNFSDNQEAKTLFTAPKTKSRISFIKEFDGKLYELPIFGASEQFSYNIINGSSNSEAPKAVPTRKKRERGATNNKNVKKSASPAASGGPIVVKPIGLNVPEELFDIKFTIDYEGTNPSTYRSDVDVTITFSADAMQSFLKTWSYNGIIDKDTKENIKFNLFDLVLLPILEKDSKGYGKMFRSQYSPNYNRIRLAYTTQPNPKLSTQGQKAFYEQNVNVLDLTPIDHDIKRDKDGIKYELSITYKGYVQSVLTSPETDVLSDKEIKAKRAERDAVVKAAIQKNCSVNEIQKIQTQLNRLAQNDVQDVSSKLIEKIYQRNIDGNPTQGLGIYKLSVDNALDSSLQDGELINIDEVKKRIVKPDGRIIASSAQNGGSAMAVQVGGETPSDNLFRSDNKHLYFFFLADLLDVAIINSSLFNDVDAVDDPVNQDVMKQQIRFIFGCFRDRNDNIINIGDIPISVDFFIDWYEENVTKKELFIYPCLSFIRDIAEKVITNLLNEICFEGSEETKMLVRTAFFPGTKSLTTGQQRRDTIFEKNTYFYSDEDNIKNKNYKVIDLDDVEFVKDITFPLIKTDFNTNVVDYVNYCSIFIRESSRLRGRAFDRNIEIPKYKLEYAKRFHGASSVNFARTTQPGLRESRYFRNSTSGITLLAGVYNVDFELTFPIHTIYPNQFFEIDLFTPPNGNIRVGNTVKSIFAELGLNGYYVVTKVSTTIGVKPKSSTVKVHGLWVSSVSPYGSRVVGADSKNIQDPAEKARLEACNSLVDLASEIGIREARAAEFNLQNNIDAITGEESSKPDSNEEIAASGESAEVGSGVISTSPALTEAELEAQFNAAYAAANPDEFDPETATAEELAEYNAAIAQQFQEGQ